MKKALLPALLLSALLGSFFLAACNNDFGIMDSIQQEEKQTTKSPFYKTTVGGIVKLGTNYYAQMAGIWKRADSGGAWAEVTGLPASYTCTGLAVAGVTMYASLLGDGVYESADGAAWSELGDASFSGKNIDAIWAANNTLFLQDHGPGTDPDSANDDVYTLYYLNGAALALAGVPAQTGEAFRGLAFADGAYWAISGTSLFTGALGSMALAVDTGMPSGKALTALTASANILYVGTDDGNVYRRAALNTWTNLLLVSGYDITALLEVAPTVPATRLLVGFGGTTTESRGYYEIDTSASSLGTAVSGGGAGALLATETVYDTTLANKPVNAFFFDVGTDRLFVGDTAGGLSSGSGLYSNLYDGSSWGGWASE